MRPGSLLLAATLSANCVFAVLLLRPTDAPPASTADDSRPAQSGATPVKVKGGKKLAREASANEAAEPVTAPPNFHWASLESTDFKQYIKNLRDLGVPEQTIRDLISAEVFKLYRPKLKAVQPPWSRPSSNYWEKSLAASGFMQPNAEQRQQEMAIYKEQAALIKDLLGDDLAGSGLGRINFYSNAPPEVQKQIAELQTKMYEKQAALLDQTREVFVGPSTGERGKIEREYFVELAKLVPPEQVEQYKLRTSELSRRVREELRAFEPTEQEFKAMIRWQEAIDSARPPSTGEPGLEHAPPATQLRNAQLRAQIKADAELAAEIGPERMTEHKILKNDWTVSQLTQSGVPKATLLRIAEMKQTAEAAARKVQTDTSLGFEQRTAALRAIRTETERELGQVLGERRARAYSSGGSGGHWIRNLAPQGNPPPITP